MPQEGYIIVWKLSSYFQLGNLQFVRRMICRLEKYVPELISEWRHTMTTLPNPQTLAIGRQTAHTQARVDSYTARPQRGKSKYICTFTATVSTRMAIKDSREGNTDVWTFRDTTKVTWRRRAKRMNGFWLTHSYLRGVQYLWLLTDACVFLTIYYPRHYALHLLGNVLTLLHQFLDTASNMQHSLSFIEEVRVDIFLCLKFVNLKHWNMKL